MTSQLISSPDGTGIKMKKIEIPNMKYIPFKESDLTELFTWTKTFMIRLFYLRLKTGLRDLTVWLNLPIEYLLKD